MMQQPLVQIVVSQGPSTGTTATVVPGQEFVVGRSKEADICVPGDEMISRNHFQIDLRPGGCQLTNLSPNGTKVNHEKVVKVDLFDGDEIRIGTNTVCRVRLRNAHDKDSRSTIISGIPTAANQPQLPTYHAQSCQSGLVSFQASGDSKISAPAELVRRLSQHGQLHAMVDFRALNIPPPGTLTSDAVLCDWLPVEVALNSTPLLMKVSGPEFDSVLKKGWGSNGIALLFGQSSTAAVLAHLKNALKFDIQGQPTNRPQGFLGICWPAVLEQLLSSGSAKLAQNLLREIDAVVLESAEVPGQWQILARETFSDVMNKLGMEPAAATLKGQKSRK